MKDNYLKRYINKFLNDIQNHDKEYFQIIKNKIKDYNRKEIISKILITIKELSFFGQITKRNIYPLCQCILYGIADNCLTVFSMNSNALTKDINKLREKPQYAQINFINTKLEQIEKKINIPINYISILPDYSNEYPFEIYENTWAKNKEYLENVSNKKAYRLSELFQRNIEKFKKKIYATININELNKIIKYYENNKFIILSFSADSNFQRNQILNYLVSGVILEKVLPFSILLDI